jgi:hypothetical protein
MRSNEEGIECYIGKLEVVLFGCESACYTRIPGPTVRVIVFSAIPDERNGQLEHERIMV